MGIESSKSPLERRNTVARRSQRRTVHTTKAKVDKALQDVKKFKGIEENEVYKSIFLEFEHLRNDLKKSSKNLQPQVKNIYHTTMKNIDEGIQALADKLAENQEKARKKQEEQEEKVRKKQEEAEEKAKLKEEKEAKKQKSKGKKLEEVKEEASEDEVTEEPDTGEDVYNESKKLEDSTEKRKTVELKFVQIFPPGEQPPDQSQNGTLKKVVSPEEKRKSILKVGGVAVMPGAMMNEIATKSKKVSVHYNYQSKENLLEDPGARINEIIENLQVIECQIADFVGRKYGTQYNRIRDKLNGYLAELTQFATSDEFLIEQIKLCKNYVGNNMSFLDERATVDSKYDSRDDVFLPDVHYDKDINNTKHISYLSSVVDPDELENKLHRLTRTTAI